LGGEILQSREDGALETHPTRAEAGGFGNTEESAPCRAHASTLGRGDTFMAILRGFEKGQNEVSACGGRGKKYLQSGDFAF
jgi:hypothetical protein